MKLTCLLFALTFAATQLLMAGKGAAKIRVDVRVTSFTIKYRNTVSAMQDGGTVKGKITNEKGDPVAGASVAIRGANGTPADVSGNFTITGITPGKHTLEISAVGFEKTVREIAVKSNEVIEVNIRLKESTEALTDVIVTGYSKQSKRDVTGAISTISPEVVAQTPVTDVGSVLQGRVAGVSVDNQGGPGNSAVVRIRGFGTLGNNDPLYVIDGVQIRGGSNLVNPNDIETITILKDPSITSLYGAEGSNGVIVITTKTGKNGPPRLEFNSYVGSQMPIRYPSTITPQQYADAYWGYLKNSGLPLNNLFYGNGSSPVLPDYIIERQGGTPLVVKEGDPAANPALYNLTSYRIIKVNKQGTDWFRQVLKPAITQNYQLTLSGATDKSNFALTFNYLDDKGILLDTYFKRFSLRVNTEFKVKPWLRIGENTEFSFSQGNNNVQNHSPQNQMADLYQRSSLLPVYDIAGNFTGPKGIPTSLALLAGGNNPVLGQLNSFNTGRGYNAGLIGAAYADVEPLKGLIFESRVGVQFYPYSFRYFQDTFPQNNFSPPNNSFTEGGGYSSDWRWTNKLSYDFTINGIHRISAFAAYESRKFVSRSNTGTTPNLPYTTGSYLYLSNGVPVPAQSLYNTVGGSGDLASSVSVFGNVNYSLLDRYLFSAVLRRDGSSKFGPLKQYGVFPSFSVGWRISDERFMNRFTWLKDLKLRAAIGSNGNDAVPTGLYENQYSANTYVSSYDLGGLNSSALTGVGLYQIGNPYLQWESNKTTNIGFDASLLNGSVTASFNWFNRVTDKLLYNPPVTGLQGDALAPYKNIMKFSNKGIELELGYISPGKTAIRYEMNLNIATYRNKVLYIDQDTSAFIPGNAYAPTHFNLNRSVVGRPVASFYGYVQEGIFQTPKDVSDHATQTGIDKANPQTGLGHFKFKDINNDGVVNENDRTFIGDPNPKFTYGYNLSLYYKQFDLGIFVQGTYGNKIFNYWRAFTQWPGALGAGSLDTWSPTNMTAKLPIWASTGAADNVPSSFFVENGSYLRIKSVQLGFTFPKSKAFSRLRVYAQAFNLATFTQYSGIDPEVSSGRPGGAGVDFGGNYPLSMKILFGVNFGL